MLLNIAIALFSALIAARVYFAIKFTHWLRHGIPFPNPRIPFGNQRDVSGHMAHFIDHFYSMFKHSAPLFGIYIMQRPIAIITNMQLVKMVLVKDFQNFSNRGMYTNERDDPLSATMFTTDGHKWRKMRTKLTPTFTSGKMKYMYPTILEVADKLEDCMSKIVLDEQRELEVKDILARFTIDVIGTFAFGIECNSLEDPNAEFRQMGKLIFSDPRHSGWFSLLIATFKREAKWLGVKVVREDVSRFFLRVVRETVEYREKEDITRNDFMDLLIRLKIEENGKLSIEEMAAQAFIFFSAGFETSSTTMMFALYELALNPAIQSKLRNDIKMVINKHGGQFSYDAMMNMHYVDKVINGNLYYTTFSKHQIPVLYINIVTETLRKYPPVPLLMRQSTHEYPVPDSNIFLPSGSSIYIPIYSIHHDPEVYPNPEAFDPDRDNDPENISFLPFGEGPRNCIGARFAMMQTRVGLITMLLNYEFGPSDRTPIPIEFDVSSFILTPRDGMWLSVKKLLSCL